MTPPRGVEDAAPYSGNPEALLLSLTSAAARGSPANLPQQRFFRDFASQTGTGEQCSPLQAFFDSLSLPPWGKVPEAPPEGG